MFGANAADKIEQAIAKLTPLSKRYSVVAANPPYMGSKNMNSWLSGWVKANYSDVKSDLFSCFIVRNLELTHNGGQLGFMTPYVWMFISSYEKLRKQIINNETITSLIQLEYSGFAGATVPICTFTLQKGYVEGYRGGYVRLSDFVGADLKIIRNLEALASPNCGWFYRRNADAFGAIPGSPIAYWASNKMLGTFNQNKIVSEIAWGCNGITTGDNERFLRYWFEVSREAVCLNIKTNSVLTSISGWVPYNKGGDFQKWAQHLDYVIDWKCGGKALKASGHLVLRSKAYMLKPALSWSKISSGKIAVRDISSGFMFDVAGLSLFPYEAKHTKFLEAFINSSVADSYLSFLSPTLNFEVGNVTSLPFLYVPQFNTIVEKIALENTTLVEYDRDSLEQSWMFKRHPLI
jgi:hypothetical protein